MKLLVRKRQLVHFLCEGLGLRPSGRQGHPQVELERISFLRFLSVFCAVFLHLFIIFHDNYLIYSLFIIILLIYYYFLSDLL